VSPLSVALPLACVVTSSLMAAAVVARDPGLRIHRALGALLVATAWWSLCEVLWQLQDDPATVKLLVRLSCLGWMSLGPIVLYIFAEISGRPRILVERAVPVAWACAAVGFLVYQLSPVVEPAWSERWGWGYSITPLFLLPYTIAVTPPMAVLLLWRRFHPLHHAAGGERQISAVLFAGVGFALAVTLVSEVVLPMRGVSTLHVGTASITLVAASAAWQLHRYGYSLLSPAAFSREILSTLGDGVALLYADATVRFANRALEELSGVGPGELHGRPIESVLPGVLARIADAHDAVELELLPEDGASLPVAVAAVRLGSPPTTALVVRDLREIRSLRDRAVTGGRLATVGELSAAIAREIQTPAEQVGTRLEGFRRRWADAATRLGEGDALAATLAEHEELIEESLDGVGRVASIARTVGSFEGAGAERDAPEDLNAIVDAALREAEDALREATRDGGRRAIVERIFGELPPVRCCAREIGQVVASLVDNALDATHGIGPVRVRTGASRTEAWIEVADEGPGIPAEVRDRMFDPFFTTKPAGEGTGLGLPLSFHVVERHGGQLRCESPPRGGTRFEVRLPLG
jgi:signal transduction histidine kinase